MVLEGSVRLLVIGVLLALALIGSMVVAAMVEEQELTGSAIDVPNRTDDRVQEPGMVEISAGHIVRVDISSR
jgi:hypothetical protein